MCRFKVSALYSREPLQSFMSITTFTHAEPLMKRPATLMHSKSLLPTPKSMQTTQTVGGLRNQQEFTRENESFLERKRILKGKFSHHFLILTSFQTQIGFFLLWNTNDDQVYSYFPSRTDHSVCQAPNRNTEQHMGLEKHEGEQFFF